MEKKRFISRFTAIWLVISLLAALLMLPGCGKNDPPIGTDNTYESSFTGSADTDSTEQSANAGDPSETPQKVVKNVIYMIADGGGYDNFTLADKVKEEMMDRGINKLTGAKTEVTNDLLACLGMSATNGLYLNEFLVGSANTLLLNPHGDEDDYTSYVTDSSAAGTALSSGYKTNYCYAGIDSEGTPRASLPELARLNGMSTGVVTTKSYVDATPLAFFTSHSIHRYEYQDNSLQALLSNVDVVIAEGTEYGDMVDEITSHPSISASSMGYTVARTKTQLLEKAALADTTKLWAPILGVDNTDKDNKQTEWDLASSHISYDVDAAKSSEQPSLLEMAQAALQVLGTNINDPDGFFLMIEGGALDNAAESGYFRPAVGEYLAFDETFGYCVNWAAQRGDTIVIATADHDSGGFSGIESCEDQLIDGIISGYIGNTELDYMTNFAQIKEALDDIGADTESMTLHGGHTDMAVPICVYAPDSVKNDLLTNMTLPTEEGDVRLGTSEYYVANAGDSFTWYTSSALNNDYTIDNTKIAPAIAKTLSLGSLDDATTILYNKIGAVSDGVFTGEYGGQILFEGELFESNYAEYRSCYYKNESAALSVYRNAAPTKAFINNMPLRSIFVLTQRLEPENGTFYVPYTVLTEGKLAWCVTISGDGCPFDKVILAKGTADIVLPAAEDGKTVTYTDGTNTYHPGDTISYNGSNIKLTAKIQ